MQLLAKVAPAPGDVVWQNTYLSRPTRMFRSWTVFLFIAILTVFWSIILVPIAGLLSLENIGRVSPQLRDALNSHQISRALVQTGIPTLVFSGLAVVVPYLYYCTSKVPSPLCEPKLIEPFRACNSSRHDLTGRDRNVTDQQKLLFHLLQPLHSLHCLRHRLQILRLLDPNRLAPEGHFQPCLHPCTLPKGFSALLHEPHHSPRPRSLPFSTSGIWLGSPLPFLQILVENTTRSRRTHPAPDLLLRLLPAPNYFNLHHLHRLLCPPRLLVRSLLRPPLLPDRRPSLQVPAPLRHGSSPTFHRQGLVNHLQPHRTRSHSLPARNGWDPRLKSRF